jgi:hypothetical protein
MTVTTACLVAGDPVYAVVRWRPSVAANRSDGKRAVSGDVVAADATTDSPATLDVADVICCDNVQELSWLTGILECHPGCAVATAPTASGGIRAMTRDRCSLTVSCRGRRPGSGALIAAIFVHAWLAAGWPLAALRPARLEVVALRAATPTWPVPLPFVLYT